MENDSHVRNSKSMLSPEYFRIPSGDVTGAMTVVRDLECLGLDCFGFLYQNVENIPLSSILIEEVTKLNSKLPDHPDIAFRLDNEPLFLAAELSRVMSGEADFNWVVSETPVVKGIFNRLDQARSLILEANQIISREGFTDDYIVQNRLAVWETGKVSGGWKEKDIKRIISNTRALRKYYHTGKNVDAAGNSLPYEYEFKKVFKELREASKPYQLKDLFKLRQSNPTEENKLNFVASKVIRSQIFNVALNLKRFIRGYTQSCRLGFIDRDNHFQILSERPLTTSQMKSIIQRYPNYPQTVASIGDLFSEATEIDFKNLPNDFE